MRGWKLDDNSFLTASIPHSVQGIVFFRHQILVKKAYNNAIIGINDAIIGINNAIIGIGKTVKL